VLIAARLRLPRPAALPRRRSFLFGLLFATIAATLLASTWPGSASGRAELALPTTRKVAADAVRVLRTDSPAAARLVERLIADAEVVTAQEATAPYWRRYPGRVEAAWGRVLDAARVALAERHRRLATYSGRWQAIADDVDRDVTRAVNESAESGVGRREIAAARQARLKWELAREFAAAGNHERALAEAEQARSFAAVVHRSFDDLHQRFREPRNLALWRRMVADTVEVSREQGSTAFVIDKLQRKLHVYENGKRVATYDAEIGAKGLRQKLHSGDEATPEGRYHVLQVRGPSETHFYKALLIDYPNAEDRARFQFGRRTGQVPLRAGIGSMIEIHGEGGQGRDWTNGCIALSNHDMDRVFAEARVGTPVTIVGTF
jgi:L,D-peptidoglycan transpeptidase YkuD (ErfK/YbiS/YcfS/YnhG family)